MWRKGTGVHGTGPQRLSKPCMHPRPICSHTVTAVDMPLCLSPCRTCLVHGSFVTLAHMVARFLSDLEDVPCSKTGAHERRWYWRLRETCPSSNWHAGDEIVCARARARTIILIAHTMMLMAQQKLESSSCPNRHMKASGISRSP